MTNYDDQTEDRRWREMVVDRLGDLKTSQTQNGERLKRIEEIAIGNRELVKATNGRVVKLELWRAEVKGIAQGSGGAGRLLLYVLGAAGTSAGIITAVMRVSG